MTWLARRYSPEKLIEWTSRRDGSRAYYATQFRQVFGVPLEQAWAAWVADEHAFQRRNLEAIRKFPLTPYRDVTPRALGSVSRAFYDPSRRRPLCRSQLSWRGRARRPDFDEDRHARSPRRHQGAAHLHGDLPRLESVRQADLLHHRQRRASRSRPARSGDASHAAPAEGRADRRSRVQRQGPIDLGHSSPERHLRRSCG